MASIRGEMQRRLALLIGRADAGARLEQRLHDVCVAMICSVVQRRVTLLVDRIHAGARLEQRPRDDCVALKCSDMQRRVAAAPERRLRRPSLQQSAVMKPCTRPRNWYGG